MGLSDLQYFESETIDEVSLRRGKSRQYKIIQMGLDERSHEWGLRLGRGDVAG